MRTNNVRNPRRGVLNEQQGTPWCQACGQTYAMNSLQANCFDTSKPCHPSFDLNSVSCQSCKDYMQHPQSSPTAINNNIDQYCNQFGQPCYVNEYEAPGKGWAQAAQTTHAKKGNDGRGEEELDTIKVRESQLINIIKKTINESQLLLERFCDPAGNDSCDGCCEMRGGGGQIRHNAGCKYVENGVTKCDSGCGSLPNFSPCSGGRVKGGGKGPIIRSKSELYKKAKELNDKATSDKIAVSESQLINIIKRTINESQLLTEGKKCDNNAGCAEGSTCTSISRGAQGYCCDAEDKSSRETWRTCAGGGMLAPGGPGKTRGVKSTTSKPGGKGRGSIMGGAKLNERKLTNIIRKEMAEQGPGQGRKLAKCRRGCNQKASLIRFASQAAKSRWMRRCIKRCVGVPGMGWGL